MIATREFCPVEAEARFREIFKALSEGAGTNEDWSDIDIVYRNAQSSGTFAEVELMMVRDHNGNSYLYSAQTSGNSLFSVTASKPVVARSGNSARAPRLRFR